MSDRPSPTPHEIEQAAYKKIIPEGKHRPEEPDPAGAVAQAPAESQRRADPVPPVQEQRTSEPEKEPGRSGYKTRQMRSEHAERKEDE